jgi:MoaA/NifB/PqqE/SkfB family radical SAM enzyme
MSVILDCTALDVGLFLSVNNKIRTCCAGKELGSITENTLDEIFTSDNFLDIKESLKQKKIPDYCKLCVKHEQDVPGSSQANHFKKFSSDGTRKIKQIDIRWNNTCNLSCRYCNTQDSSAWQQLKNIPLVTVNRDYYQSIFNELERNIDHIEEVSLLGGEPLMLKQNEQLLAMLRPDTKITVISNLSLKLENNKIYNLLKKSSNVSWHISLDNIGDRFEYVRHGAEWERLNHNIDLITKDFSSVSIGAVYGIWSATNASDLIKFAVEKKIAISWSLVNDNDYPNGDNRCTSNFSIFKHDNRIKMMALKEAKKVLRIVAAYTTDRIHNTQFFKGVINQLCNSMEGDNVLISDQFLKWTTENEALMPPKKNFRELWPELYEILIDK